MYLVRQSTQVRIVLHTWESGKSVVKSMLHEDKRDSGTGRSCIKPRGTAILSFVCAQAVREWLKEVTVSCRLGYQTLWKSAWVRFPTPRWPAKGVTWSSQMRSLWNPPLLGTTIWSTLSELWHITRDTLHSMLHETVDHWTMLFAKNETYNSMKCYTTHFISIIGTMAPPI